MLAKWRRLPKSHRAWLWGHLALFFGVLVTGVLTFFFAAVGIDPRYGLIPLVVTVFLQFAVFMPWYSRASADEVKQGKFSTPDFRWW